MIPCHQTILSCIPNCCDIFNSKLAGDDVISIPYLGVAISWDREYQNRGLLASNDTSAICWNNCRIPMVFSTPRFFGILQVQLCSYINPFIRSFDLSLFICPLKNVPDLLQIKSGLRHKCGGINPLFRSFDNP